MRRALVCVLSLLILPLVALGCEEGTNVTFRNETSAEVTIWRGLSRARSLQPGEKVTFSTIYFPNTTTIRVTDIDEQVLFERTFTFDELKAYGDIVVTESSPTPASQGARMSHTVGMTTTDYIWDVAAGLPLVLHDGQPLRSDT